MNSWAIEDTWGDVLEMRPHKNNPRDLEINIEESSAHQETQYAAVILNKLEATALRDALTRFIEAMP